MCAMQSLILSVLITGIAVAQQQNAASETVADGASKAEAISKEQMVKFVEAAAAYVKQAGKETALKEFSNPKGKFVRFGGELYIYAYDFKCICLAHGSTPELIGKDLTDKKDSAGSFVIQQLRDTAAKGQGFVEYGWRDPATGKEGRKLGYVVKVDDALWLGSGIYLK